MTENSVLNFLYSGTITKQDLDWNNLNTVPILQLISIQDIEYIRSLILSPRYSGNNKLKMDKINEVMHARGFFQFAGGTNRLVYTHPSAPNAVFKVAIDSVGINDNPAEFRNQNFLKPYCCKVFECSPCGTIASFEKVDRITTFEEFYSIADDYWYLITRKILGKYVMEDIGINYWMNFGIRNKYSGLPESICGPVILDFPYLFELDGTKLECQNLLPDGTICHGEIDYDIGFNKLVCKKCGRKYHARDLSKRSDGIGALIRQKGSRKMQIDIVKGDKVVSRSNSTIERDHLSKSDPDVNRQVVVEKKIVTVPTTVIKSFSSVNSNKTMNTSMNNKTNNVKEVITPVVVDFKNNTVKKEEPISDITPSSMVEVKKEAVKTVVTKINTIHSNPEKITRVSNRVSVMNKNNSNAKVIVKPIIINLSDGIKEYKAEIPVSNNEKYPVVKVTTEPLEKKSSNVSTNIVRNKIKVESIRENHKSEPEKNVKEVVKFINVNLNGTPSNEVLDNVIPAVSNKPVEEKEPEIIKVKETIEPSVEEIKEKESIDEEQKVQTIEEVVAEIESKPNMVQAITFEDEEVSEDKSVDEVIEDEVVETDDGVEDTKVESVEESEAIEEEIVETSEETDIESNDEYEVESNEVIEDQIESNDETSEIYDNQSSYYIYITKELPTVNEVEEYISNNNIIPEKTLILFCIPKNPNMDIEAYKKNPDNPVTEALFDFYYSSDGIVTLDDGTKTINFARIVYDFNKWEFIAYNEDSDEIEYEEDPEIQTIVSEGGEFANEVEEENPIINPLYNTGSTITAEEAMSEALLKTEKESISKEV